MSWFKNLKIRTKMLASFLLVTLVMVSLSIVSIVQLRSIATTYQIIIDHVSESRQSIAYFQSNFRDLRRLVSTLSTYTGYDMDRCEALIKDSTASYEASFVHLDNYDNAVRTNPSYDENDIKIRIDNSQEIRNIALRYYNDFMEPMFEAARTGNHATSLQVIATAGPIATEIRNAVQEMLDRADETVIANSISAREAEEKTTYLLIGMSVVAAVIAILIAFYMAALISKPMNTLSGFMKKAGATGDINLRPEDLVNIANYAKIKDEIGETISNTAVFIKHIINISDELNNVAKGDLRTEMDILSESDVMGMALKNTIESLNDMFTEINVSAEHVAKDAADVEESAKQIADTTTNIAEGAQQLAKGATDQAASVEELSSSISIIEEKTQENARIAGEASVLADNVISNATKGNQQMQEMIDAVKQIAEANQSIQSIMNTIDSIASQTNLLSLNAAIEAARAGEHGRGFAVVADEVRILAAQSAEAAQQTSAIIQISIEKSQLGTRIVDETAESFREIVTGLNESSKLIKSIASASMEQAANISHVKSGIDQVSDIVEQNSATAQESAAASEESAAAATESITSSESMKSQAAMLQKLISKFKLK
ncbi:MAG: methyl-accepting chemotaxis protein [Lachnospiraceae bacterium]|nr:methyl-accepting chemotaxis protein [Lachnospiraceae bacterium]